jgi:hypothetical protein
MRGEELGQSLQGRVRFVLRVRLRRGNDLGCSIGAFSARRSGAGEIRGGGADTAAG